MAKRENDLGRDPIGKLLLRLAVPTVTAQLVNALYNIVDRIYIGHIPEIGEAALTQAFVVVRPDGSAAGYNCRVMRRGKKSLIVVPSEPQIRTVHFNIPARMEATVEFSSGLVKRQVGPMEWLTAE